MKEVARRWLECRSASKIEVICPYMLPLKSFVGAGWIDGGADYVKVIVLPLDKRRWIETYLDRDDDVERR